MSVVMSHVKGSTQSKYASRTKVFGKRMERPMTEQSLTLTVPDEMCISCRYTTLQTESCGGVIKVEFLAKCGEEGRVGGAAANQCLFAPR